MCTALNLNVRDHYFGRTLDVPCSYNEQVCIMPRNFPMRFRKMGQKNRHFAIIGMAMVAQGVPLYYDAANEKGLCMAGLNFVGNAYYFPEAEGKDNVTPFEFIPWILGQCETVQQARGLLERVNLVDIPFSADLPLARLHWIISDRTESVVVESTADGLHIYDNPTGVMANNPPFPYHLVNLNNYRGLQAGVPENRFCPELNLDVYSNGMGALGLPGDTSSMSRFVRMVFNSKNSVCEPDENSAVGQFFHLLDDVAVTRGTCMTKEGQWNITVCSVCVNATRGLYYYTTYENRRIGCVDLHKADLEGSALSLFPLEKEQSIFRHN